MTHEELKRVLDTMFTCGIISALEYQMLYNKSLPFCRQ